MCGLAGLWDRHHRYDGGALEAAVAAMTNSMVHRGPDAHGSWADPELGIALGHRRLSIVDLSSAGAQPMVSSCGRFVISYNGEIYNATELRPELERAGRRFRGHSDTEVILEGMAVWGIQETIQRLIGMFAIAVWDRRERSLYLVRDRIGIKPVYWAELDGQFMFGSELKALRAQADWCPELEESSLAAFLRFGYVPGPQTIYRGVQKLQPGSILRVSSNTPANITVYWSLQEIALEGQAARFRGDENEAAEALEILLRDAIKRRMIADVPLGSFLSGGIDSSTVVALMQAESQSPVRTFSIGFHEAGYDESKHAAEVARHLGTEHTELYAAPKHALELIPRLPEIYDEPFADSSQIPTYLVSEMTRRHVTVALSGDGGDELFAGYTRYFRREAFWRALEAMPRSARKMAACGVRTLSPEAWTAFGNLIPEARRPAQFGDKMHKLANVLEGEPEASAFYRQIISLWVDPGHALPGVQELPGLFGNERVRACVPNFVERMQYLDTLTYLPDDILTKVDRASMAVSLEARVPLLDHRVVEFSWSLPPEMKTGHGRYLGKRVLRQLLYRYVPKAMVERPKKGFSVPVHQWLRGGLREWAEALLDEQRLRREGIFEPTEIRRRWRDHLDDSGSQSWDASLWAVLMFQAWKERWMR